MKVAKRQDLKCLTTHVYKPCEVIHTVIILTWQLVHNIYIYICINKTRLYHTPQIYTFFVNYISAKLERKALLKSSVMMTRVKLDVRKNFFTSVQRKPVREGWYLSLMCFDRQLYR